MPDKNKNDYICDDMPVELSAEIANMTDDEIEIEFQKDSESIYMKKIRCNECGAILAFEILPITNDEI